MDYSFKYRKVSEVLYKALIQDEFYISLAQSVDGSDEEKRAAILKYMDYSIIEGEQFGKCVIPTGQYGASIWSLPISSNQAISKKKNKKAFLLNHMGQGAWDFYQSVVGFMDTQSDDLIPINAWYLSIVGLHPDFQSQGLGKTLISSILEKADKQGFTTYLETFTPRNMKFYKKLGYKPIGSFYEPTVQQNYWMMARQPASNTE